MQSMKRTRRETSRLVLTGILCFLLVGLIAGCETPNGTKEVLQPRPHEHSHPESATWEDVRAEIQTMVGPVIESLMQETSAAIEKLRGDVEKRFKIADTGALNYEVRYEFDPDSFVPLDPRDVRPEKIQEAINEASARERFFSELARYLDERKKKGFQIEVHRRAIERVPNFISSIRLMNAQAVSDGRRHQDHISEAIAALAIQVGDPDLAVPVRRDEDDAPFPVRRLTLTDNATSGVGDVAKTCEQTTTFTVEGIPEDADPFVYDDINGLRPFEDSFPFPHDYCGQSIEEALVGRDPHAYILVRKELPPLEDEKKEYVAQYRSIHMISEAETQIPVGLTERAPACPPMGVPPEGVSTDAATAFKKELGPCVN